MFYDKLVTARKAGTSNLGILMGLLGILDNAELFDMIALTE